MNSFSIYLEGIASESNTVVTDTIHYKIVDSKPRFVELTEFKRETSAFVLLDAQELFFSRILDITSNNATSSVEFNFESIWEQFKEANKQSKIRKVMMIHSHPEGFPVISGTDTNMVHGWRLALGCDIIFPIICGHKIMVYLCTRKKNSSKNETEIKFIGKIVLLNSTDQMVQVEDESNRQIMEIAESFAFNTLYRIIKTISYISDEKYLGCDFSKIKEELQILQDM